MRTLTMAAGLLLCAACAAQTNENARAQPKDAVAEDRLLLPHNFLRGYVDFEVAPPHNEPDLGMCAPHVGPLAPGAQNCADYARYIWSGYVELQPFGRTPLKRVFLFVAPQLFGGDNVPQLKYTASASGILWEDAFGAGVMLPRQLELRVTHHQTNRLGRYAGWPNSLILRPDGPYGMYTTVGVRWYFGGYGRASAH
ncbi:MAG: hypothetical protein ABSH46_13280 [Bryobacteraceae bacterium]